MQHIQLPVTIFIVLQSYIMKQHNIVCVLGTYEGSMNTKAGPINDIISNCDDKFMLITMISS